MNWIVKVETEIEDEEAEKLLMWGMRKVGMKVISISKEENPVWWPQDESV